MTWLAFKHGFRSFYALAFDPELGWAFGMGMIVGAGIYFGVGRLLWRTVEILLRGLR